MQFKRLIFYVYLFFAFIGNAQQIPTDKVIENSKLSDYLKEDIKTKLSTNGFISEAELANYFRVKFSERYFFNWENFDDRFKKY